MTYGEMPPVMREMLKLLPPAGAEWPTEDRVRWLQSFEAVSKLVFKDDASLSIKVLPRS